MRAGALVVACAVAWAWPAAAAPAAATAQEWWRGDVFYEVFVRSFADGDGDGTGDLRGVTEHLDDLRALGVDDLWLMPIFPSPSDHGYDVTDETGVNPAYGTLTDFRRLVDGAHRRHMHVILDFVLNHTSDRHPWFVAAARDPQAKTRSFYLWKTAPDDRWRRPWDGAPVWREKNGAYYLALFDARMPDLNLENDAVVDAMVRAMETWLDRGVDGFRLDAVRHLIERDDGKTVTMTDTAATHALLRKIHARLAEKKPDVLLVGEAWADNAVIATYAQPDQVQLAFSFDVAGAIVDAVKEGGRGPLVEALAGAEAAFADAGAEATFLTNHDQVRAMRDFGGDVDEAKLAAAILFALPGTPFVYYGEELGMQGGAARPDENKRTPYHWTDPAPGFGFSTSSSTAPWLPSPEAPGVDARDERAAPRSLWNWYRRLIALRHAEPALTSNVERRLRTDGGGRGTFAMLRGDGDRRVLFVANIAGEKSAAFVVDAAGTPSTLLASGLTAPFVRSAAGIAVPPLSPHAFAFVALAAEGAR